MQLLNKKIRVFLIGSDNVDWSIDSDRANISNLFNNAEDFEITKNIFKADIIYSVWYNVLERPWYFYSFTILKKIKGVKIFAVITNRIENTPEKIFRLKKVIDIWVSPSTTTHNFIKDHNLSSIHIPFLVDDAVFYKIHKSRAGLLKLLNLHDTTLRNKLLIGSFQRDSLGNDLTKPKWQKDPDLLIKILTTLSKDSFTLIIAGPRRHYLINKCKRFNIPYIFIGNEALISSNKDDIQENNLSLNKINILYNLIDLYLITSKSEGGPKAAIESALTETLVFSTNVGLVSDLIHRDLIFPRNNISIIKKNLTHYTNDKESFNDKILYNKQHVNKALNKKTILTTIKQAYEN